MFAVEKWDLLYPARVYSPSCEHRMIHIADAGIDIRLRIEFEEVRYDEFSSSEVDEPVGDDGDFFIWIHFLCQPERG